MLAMCGIRRSCICVNCGIDRVVTVRTPTRDLASSVPCVGEASVPSGGQCSDLIDGIVCTFQAKPTYAATTQHHCYLTRSQTSLLSIKGGTFSDGSTRRCSRSGPSKLNHRLRWIPTAFGLFANST